MNTKPLSKSDERLIRAMQDPECRAAVETLRKSGYAPGTIANVMNTMRILDLPDDARVAALRPVSIPIAHGECGITWLRAYGYVWCVRSTTQCDYCGPFALWTVPPHATPTRKAHP